MSCENTNGIDFHECVSEKANDCGRGSYRSSVSRDMLLPNVFVQIPANHGPITKGPIARHYDEIKAEPPIKSEIENVQQQNSVGQRFSSKDVDSNNDSDQFPRAHFADDAPSSTSPTSTTTSSTTLVTARPKSAAAVKCFKCMLCPFMSISQTGYDGHMANVHANQSEHGDDADHMQREKILCPGCENVFYSKKSLKIHLANDHQMSASEIMPLLESLFAQSDSKARKSTTRKQKIYLKNVEILKKPQFSSSQFARHENIDTSSMERVANDTNMTQTTGEYLFDEAHLNSDFGQTDLIDDLGPSYSLTDLTSVAGSVSSVSDSVPITPDDTMSVRPDSGNSIKYCENLAMIGCDGWTNANHSAHFQNYDQPMSNWNFISENRSTADSTSPMPLTTSTSSAAPVTAFGGGYQNEKKKIFIKNIDILKEPLITPATSMCAESTSGRKHMLHLRTVDEVNLMLSNKVRRCHRRRTPFFIFIRISLQVQNEGHSYSAPTEVITLDEDDYHYVLNDAVDYNSAIIPHYFENEMNDLVSNYLTTPDYMPNYATPSTYSLTNLDVAAPATNSDGVIVLDANADGAAAVVEQQRNGEQPSIPYGGHHVIDYDFLSNKFIQPRTMDGPDYMLVSSDAIIDTADDILDLTTDEVDQIIGSQCFDGFTQAAHDSTPQTNKARINVVGNLMRADFAAAVDDANDDEVNHTAETPKLDLVRAADGDVCVQSTTRDAIGQAKKRSGRPKGARKMCK